MTKHDFTLYFSPLACSFASRAVIYDVEANAKLVEVKQGKTETGEDFTRVNPLGLVPALVLPDGDVITENAAVLQYLGDRYPERGLAPVHPRERTRLHTWLSFIGMELHKGIFAPLFDESSPAEAKAYAVSKAERRFGYLASTLGERASLLEGGVSVADAYLCAVLNWTVATPIRLSSWPTLKAYHAGLLARPSFARALAEERPLWATRNPEKAKLLRSATA